MFGFYLFSSLALAALPPLSEEEVSEESDFGFSGSVVEIECLSSSYNQELGMTTENYEALVIVDTILKGEDVYADQQGTPPSEFQAWNDAE